jgi:hypothetical protein
VRQDVFAWSLVLRDAGRTPPLGCSERDTSTVRLPIALGPLLDTISEVEQAVA